MPLIRKPKQPNYEDKPKSKLIKRVKLIDPNGKDGYTPIKGVDYFDGETPTDEQLIKLIRPLIPQVKDGIDGKTPTVDELLALIKPLIPEVKNGETPSDERLIALITPLIPEYKSITCEEVIDEINSKKEILDIKTIKGLSKEIESRIPKNMIGSPRIKMFKDGQEKSSPLGSLNVKGSNLTNNGQDYTIDTTLQTVTDMGAETTNPITVGGLTTPYVQFDTTAGVNVGEGELAWNATDETLDLGMPDGITLQIGQENQIKARNNTGSTILNGKAVYVSGALGNRPTITLAQGNAHSTGHIIGLTTQDISNNADGKVTTSGYVRNIDTTGTPYGETWADGDTLWLSKTIAGGLTNTEPSVPHHSALIGIVTKAHITQGAILVNITQHQALEHLSDVNGTPLTTTGQIPVWNQTAGYFDFTSNVSGFVPYTGASSNVNLGSYELTTGQLNTAIIKSPGSNTITFKNLLNTTMATIDSNGNVFAGIISAPVGSASAPSYSFTGDLTTGAYRIGAGIYGIATAGVERARFTSTGATLTTPSTATGGLVGLTLAANTWTNSKLVNKLLASSVTITQSGTAGFTLIDVSYALNSVGSGEANLLRFSQTGTDYFKVAASGQMTTRLGSNTIPTHSFVGDTDTGMYSAGANILSFAVGGTNSFTLQSDFSGKFASTNPTLYLESTGTNAVNAGQIIYRTPSGSESFTTTFDASANIFNFKYGATTAFTITGSIVTSVLNHRFANGSASSPSISFTGDINTGLYYIAGDVMGISTGGAERMRVSNSYIIATVPFETYSYRAINSTDNILTEFRSYASSNGAGIYGQGNLIFNSGGGSSAYANMDFLAGETNTQIGGNMTFTGGLTEAGGYSGGYITMTGGYSYGGDGGYISIIGGSTVAANGGYVQIFGGDTSAGGGSAGGGVDIRGGYNSNTLQYATVYLQANGGITNIGATSFTVDTYGGAITSNIYHTFTANTSFYGTMQTQGMPTADPMDGQGTLWYDTSTNLVYRGT